MAAKLTNGNKQELARQLYIEAGMSQREIAEYVDTSETQVSRWKTRGKWEDLRKVKTLSSSQLIVNCYKMSQKVYDDAETEDRALTAKDGDLLLKLSATIRNLEKELNVQTATLVFKGFNEFLLKSGQLELAKELAGHEREFVINLMPNE